MNFHSELQDEESASSQKKTANSSTKNNYAFIHKLLASKCPEIPFFGDFFECRNTMIDPIEKNWNWKGWHRILNLHPSEGWDLFVKVYRKKEKQGCRWILLRSVIGSALSQFPQRRMDFSPFPLHDQKGMLDLDRFQLELEEVLSQFDPLGFPTDGICPFLIFAPLGWNFGCLYRLDWLDLQWVSTYVCCRFPTGDKTFWKQIGAFTNVEASFHVNEKGQLRSAPAFSLWEGRPA